MKYIVFLGDGMADEPIAELGGKTPLMVADIKAMDWIAKNGVSGKVKTLFEGYPTSSDVANMGVLGYDVKLYNSGRGPIEAASQKINLERDEIAFRCNLINVRDNILTDYSGGQITQNESEILIKAAHEKFKSDKIRFYPGVSYRNLLIIKGDEFSSEIKYSKPDDEQGTKITNALLLRPINEKDEKQKRTCNLLNEIMLSSYNFLSSHEINVKREKEGKRPANMLWFWSPGKKPNMPSFYDKYGKKGAIISAVDVIFGLGELIKMTTIRVKGATGFIDTNYEGKADACIKALEDLDFVFVHVEAPDECGHAGDLENKIKAIEDIDKRLIQRVMNKFSDNVAYSIIPDHPVPINLRKHTRTPVPMSLYVPGIKPDKVLEYNEDSVDHGQIGLISCLDYLNTFFSI
jgi:2,3-bisphosphoglycerate-independent phosphoglycerate mutase